MKYFEIVVDERVHYQYQIQQIAWHKENEQQFGVGYFKGEEEEVPDFIIFDKKILVSNALKQVMEMYDDLTQFTLVVLSNLELKVQKEYYMVEAVHVEALSEKTTYLKNGWIDTMYFSAQKVADYKVFHLQDEKANAFTPIHLFMDLDIVESILRRALWGMCFKEILLEA